MLGQEGLVGSDRDEPPPRREVGAGTWGDAELGDRGGDTEGLDRGFLAVAVSLVEGDEKDDGSGRDDRHENQQSQPGSQTREHGLPPAPKAPHRAVTLPSSGQAGPRAGGAGG